MKHYITLTLSFLLFSSLLHAKNWRNKDGSRSFRGEFVSFNKINVKIKKIDDTIVEIPISRLHPEDQKWVRNYSAKAKANAALNASNSVFAGLNFGDSKDVVMSKLKKSDIVESSVSDIHLGRTGLNGIFRTKAKIGPYKCSVFFDWTSQDKLKEITLRTDDLQASDYDTNIKRCWEQMVHLTGEIIGSPVHKTTYPMQNNMQDGMSMNTHLYRIQSGGSALVGIGFQDGKYMVTTRFTRDTVDPSH